MLNGDIFVSSRLCLLWIFRNLLGEDSGLPQALAKGACPDLSSREAASDVGVQVFSHDGYSSWVSIALSSSLSLAACSNSKFPAAFFMRRIKSAL